MFLALALCTVVSVYDGDGPIHCANGDKLRLLGIQAPDYERAEPCKTRRPRYVCNDKLANRARDNLRRLVPVGTVLRVEIIKNDRYGRQIANAWSGSTNLSCAQIRGGFAQYRVDYDDGRRIGKACSL